MQGLLSKRAIGTPSNSEGESSVQPNVDVNCKANNPPAVCLVDDDPSVLKATGRLLSSAGWKTESFTDPKAFLRYAEDYHPRVVVLDIWMPVMNGLEVQAKLRCVSPATRVVVLTSKDDPSVRSKALEAGASGFFLKPPSDEEFLKRIESIYREAGYR